MAKKEFSNKRFQKTNNQLAFWMLAFIGLGIASGVCAFTVQGGVQGNFAPVGKGADPKDYYGTYHGYSSTENKFIDLEVNKSGAKYVLHNGINSNCPMDSYKYDFISNTTYLRTTLNDETIPDGTKALYIYKDSQKDEALVLYAKKANSAYTFTSRSGGLAISKKEVSFARTMNDPRNYFGIYTYSTYNIELKADGTVKYNIGSSTTKKYSYVTNAWVKSNFPSAKGLDLNKPFICMYDQSQTSSKSMTASFLPIDVNSKTIRFPNGSSFETFTRSTVYPDDPLPPEQEDTSEETSQGTSQGGVSESQGGTSESQGGTSQSQGGNYTATVHAYKKQFTYIYACDENDNELLGAFPGVKMTYENTNWVSYTINSPTEKFVYMLSDGTENDFTYGYEINDGDEIFYYNGIEHTSRPTIGTNYSSANISSYISYYTNKLIGEDAVIGTNTSQDSETEYSFGVYTDESITKEEFLQYFSNNVAKSIYEAYIGLEGTLTDISAAYVGYGYYDANIKIQVITFINPDNNGYATINIFFTIK